MEFPHLQRLIEGNQFDTIYHEHFSYLSFSTVERFSRRHGLVLFDVEELPTHGGSLRIYARHAANEGPVRRVQACWRARAGGATEPGSLHAASGAQVQSDETGAARTFLIEAKPAPAKGGGLRCAGQGQHPAQLLRHPQRLPGLHHRPNPYKQGKWTPGTHIPILDAGRRSSSASPDYVLILPWNLKDEIMPQDGLHPRVGRAASWCRSRPCRSWMDLG
jgi:hypothetical protein